MSIKEVRTLLTSGTMLLHKTTDGHGALQCFSLVTVLSNNVLLAYIATDQTKRSSGVGSKHMKVLIDLLKKLYPTYIGLFLEIESTKEKNLPADEEKGAQTQTGLLPTLALQAHAAPRIFAAQLFTRHSCPSGRVALV